MYTFYRKKKRFERNKINSILEKEKYDILIDFQSILPFRTLNNKVIAWQHLYSGKIKNKEKLRKYLNKIRKKL